MTQASKSIQAWLEGAGRRRCDDHIKTIELCAQLKNCVPESKQYLEVVNKVCENNLLLVATIVRQFVSKRPWISWSSGQVEDLLQQGYFGLRRAVEKFDTTKGYRFSTYATPSIRQAIGRYYNNTNTTIRIPEGVTQQIYYIAKHGKKNVNSRAMTSNESLIRAGQAAMYTIALDAPAKGANDDASPLHETVAYEPPTPSHEVGNNWASRLLDKAISAAKLSPEEAGLIRAYAQRGRIVSAAIKCGMSEKKAGPMIRDIMSRLKETDVV